MPTPIDFAKLSLQDALDLAVLVEDEAHERYLDFAGQMDLYRNEDSAKFFRSMADNEARHGKELLARRKALFGDAPRKVGPAMVWEVEAPGYEQADGFMTPKGALDVALAAERKALAFFRSALPHLGDLQVKTLFEELCLDEELHEKLVLQQIAKLPPEPELHPETNADPPVAQ